MTKSLGTEAKICYDRTNDQQKEGRACLGNLRSKRSPQWRHAYLYSRLVAIIPIFAQQQAPSLAAALPLRSMAIRLLARLQVVASAILPIADKSILVKAQSNRPNLANFFLHSIKASVRERALMLFAFTRTA